MKFKKLPQFERDYNKLTPEERAKFKEMLAVFIPACDRYALDVSGYTWPASLRFEKLTSTKSVLAITWSFSGPDGRATFQFDTVDGELMVVWRRVGRHSIYKSP
ncbi:hypothetical protein [Pseudoclavibacter helvolus]|uniref:hypothetical protein n=1 Tax=Pseudoclavibacter helvolus TaxID=255205 RepID=UPI0024AE7C06|nr:hypothetical protein [Pseudoclavibacter helvolus]